MIQRGCCTNGFPTIRAAALFRSLPSSFPSGHLYPLLPAPLPPCHASAPSPRGLSRHPGERHLRHSPPALPGGVHGAVSGGDVRRPGAEVLPPHRGRAGAVRRAAGGLAGDPGRLDGPGDRVRTFRPGGRHGRGKYFSRKPTSCTTNSLPRR